MRLIRLYSDQRLRIHEFTTDIPPYAILSHTWGPEEVSFQEFYRPESRQKAGYDKILRCCRQAAKDGLEYTWIDTCCIDKSSSAELSETINSMFKLYRDAEICDAHLADVPENDDMWERHSPFRKSRWFTRGWTLQELIAPRRLTFYSSEWTKIKRRSDLTELLQEITVIEQDVLDGDIDELPFCCVAQKMSWASLRQTSRPEDIAYCLLGIFNINLPIIYGEGERSAFYRLQEEIIKQSDDQSIFAWEVDSVPDENLPGWVSILAESPRNFQRCGSIQRCSHFSAEHYEITNKGLRITLPKKQLAKREFVGA